MNQQTTRNTALAFVGLLALCIYILACSSPAFSPDDKKVLYPAFDAASGAIGMAVYDRETRQSEMAFVPVAYQDAETNAVVGPTVIRAQWLANGRDIVATYLAPKDGDRNDLTVAMMPWGARGPIKTFRMPEIKDAAAVFMTPLCVAGERLFLSTSDKQVTRLDLRTGALTNHVFAEAEGAFSIYPTPDGDGVFYSESGSQPDSKAVFGRLNPNDFSLTPLMVITNDLPQDEVIAYDKTGRILALLEGGRETNSLVVLRDGQPIFARSLDTHGQERNFINAILATNGKAIRATFQRADGTNVVSYGLMEIPFSEAPPREVTLIKEMPVEDKDSAYYFQMAVSHDGKTAAVASTYLACTEKGLNPADCALFFVDLSDPKWKVTKVPIPVPAKRPPLPK